MRLRTLMPPVSLLEKILVSTVQRECFPEPKNVPIIDVVKDNEGLLRVKTKITERKDDPCFLTPILLPANCALTTRLVEYLHKSNCHAAKVLELLPGRDGNIRTLKLKCGNAEIIRPVQRLFPLEIRPEELPIADVGMEGFLNHRAV
ncbi:integrase_H2C2 domain-containing protein [Trichonephila clavata]|uniref:Integrase_H2C2 domain-containing protein n=1 Tax=Trichonephila clavata TaxID=2740835 RepID=A0A8X6F5V1_TRICU|nr:integrase_H2C2 domain-containing protein [Trichonephila clavata]